MLPCAFRLQSAVAQPGAGAGVGRARLCGLVGDCQRHMPCAMPRMRTPWGAGSGRRRGAADGLALLLCRAATTTPTTQQNALPNDPAALKLLLAAKDGELRAKDGELLAKDGELRAKDGALRATDVALRSQEGELRLAHKFVEELKERVKEVKEGKADFHARAMALENRLGCRSVLEGLEQKLSPLRRSSAKARRKTVWREICKREPAFFAKLLKTLDLKEHVGGMTEKEQREAVVQAMVDLYKRLASDIHHPNLRAIPIQLAYLGPNDGAAMIVCCQEYEVSYSLHDMGLRLESPPPAVARLLGEGEGEGEEGDDGM